MRAHSRLVNVHPPSEQSHGPTGVEGWSAAAPCRRWKLPWLFALTAALTVAAFGFFAYASARALALETATTRLRSALSQARTVAELGIVN